MVELGVGVINSQRVLFGGDVIAEHKVKLVLAVSHSCDGGNGVVGLAAGLREDEALLVGVAPPEGEYPVSQRDDALPVSGAQPDDRHRPLDYPGLYVLKALEAKLLLHGSLRHCEFVVAALKMLVSQYGAAHDRQVGVGADEVVRELLDEIKQLAEGAAVYDHRRVALVEEYAVLVVVDVGGVL